MKKVFLIAGCIITLFHYFSVFSIAEYYKLKLPQGMNFVSISVKPSNSDPFTGLGITNPQIFRLQNRKYVYDVGISKLQAGNGYWLFLPEEKEITIEGEEVKTNSYEIYLEAGWNQIGNPFLSNVLWNSTNVCVSKKGESHYKSLSMSDELLKSPLFKFNKNSGLYFQFDPSEYTNINSWEGFWVKAIEDCKLLIFKDVTLNIYTENSTGKIGEEINIPVKITTTTSSFQTFKFDININKSVLNFNGIERTDLTKDFTCQVGSNNKSVIFYVMNQANSLPCNIEGEIAKLRFTVQGSVGMESEVKIENIEFLTSDYKKVLPPFSSSTFKVVE